MPGPYTLNLNQNTADCIKSTSHFTHTDYINICNGITATVPMGGLDYIGNGLLVLGGVLLCGVLLWFIIFLSRYSII